MAGMLMLGCYGAGHWLGESTRSEPVSTAALSDGVRHAPFAEGSGSALVTVVEACGRGDDTARANELLSELREQGSVQVLSMLAPRGAEPGIYVNGLKLLPPWTEARLSSLVAIEKARSEARWLRDGDHALLAEHSPAQGAIAYIASCPVD